jgi:anti-sigma-K factor RskA
VSGPSNPQLIDDEVDAYVLGTLAPAERRRFEVRLAESAALRQQTQAAQTTLWLLAESPTQLSPSSRLRGRILAAVAAEEGEPAAVVSIGTARRVEVPPQTLAGGRSLLQRRWSSWLAVAAVLVAIGLGGWNLQLQQQLQLQRTIISEERQALQTLIAADKFWTMRGVPERAPEALSTLAVNLRQRQTVLAVTGFPVLPPGQVYQVWVVQNGRQVAVGKFNPPATTSEVTLVIPSDLAGVSHAMITVEPAEGSPQPTGQVVMGGDL